MANTMKPVPFEQMPNFFECLLSEHEKYGVLFIFGIKTGLRISDILRLRAGDIKRNMRVHESKTKKVKAICHSDEMLAFFEKYIARHRLEKTDAFIYSSRTNKKKAVSRVQAYRVFKAVAETEGMQDIGTHSMRKTFASTALKATGSFKSVQRLLSHEDIDTTIRYFVDLSQLAEKIQKGKID